MMLKEVSMQIKFLAGEGVPKSRIAQRLGVTRQTVYNHLARTEPFPKPRPKRGSKLDAFKAYVRSRLELFDLPATVLLRELREQGYAGELTVLRDYARTIKKELVRRVTERFETLPGHQAQIDWGECGTIELGGERRKLYVFVLVLGYSRMMYAHFTTSSKLPVLLTCLSRAFHALGVPAEILVDNMKQAVDQHDVTTGTVRWNRQFLDFAEHHSFLPVACPPYWPRVKGKVERGVGYIKTSFLEGRSFTDLVDLNRQLEAWLEAVANVRIHGTTRERPIDRHSRELPHLRPFAAIPAYDTRSLDIRRVTPDARFSFGGVLYSVDPVAVGHTVTIRSVSDEPGSEIAVSLGDQLVALHRRRPKGSPPAILPEHLDKIRRLTRGQAARARRPGSQPHFEQSASPVVEARPLSVYEEVARESVA